MIAPFQSTAAEWSAGSLPPERSGSLRRIDDIVSELLAGYRLADAADTATFDMATSPANNASRIDAAAGVTPPVGGPLVNRSGVGRSFVESSMADASPGELMLMGER
ncbi:MAG TPA: hypothetical protein VGG30_07870 [Pirellulales bacterium]|jgi:hypothetical protein